MLLKKKVLGLLLMVISAQAQEPYAVEPLTEALANEYKLDNNFYKKIDYGSGNSDCHL